MTGWLRCNCALTPPTMPTCRSEHLRSCPMHIYDAVVRMEAEAGSFVDPLPYGKVTVEAATIAAGVHGAAAMTARSIRVLMEQAACSESNQNLGSDT